MTCYMPGAAVGGALLAAVDLPAVLAAAAVAVECVVVVWPCGSQSLKDSASFRSTSQPEQPIYLSNTHACISLPLKLILTLHP